MMLRVLQSRTASTFQSEMALRRYDDRKGYDDWKGYDDRKGYGKGSWGKNGKGTPGFSSRTTTQTGGRGKRCSVRSDRASHD